jgi:predicted DCC family thiol-disulfide oxidoreductase YuxK
VEEKTHAPVLVYDGGCPFCSHFAELSELRGGIPELIIRDGRADSALRQSLAQRGCHLRDGAVLMDGEHLFHGAEAIHWMAERFQPSAPLLQLLTPFFVKAERAQGVYPLLLLARRAALALRGLPVDPDSR